MSQEAVGKLIDRWLNEPKFRDEIRNDPEGTVKKAGVELSPDEWKALRNVNWDMSDEELKSRVNLG